MAAALQAAITRAWQGRGKLSTALLPISWIYGALTAVHRWTYASGLKRSEKLQVPVIVVGNVIAGGAGKTPTVLGVVSHLQNLGFKPAILSRGYGGSHQSPTVVADASTAHDVGDEPLLLRHRPVFLWWWGATASQLASCSCRPIRTLPTSCVMTACSTTGSFVTWKFAYLIPAAWAMDVCFPQACCGNHGPAHR